MNPPEGTRYMWAIVAVILATAIILIITSLA